MFNNPGRKIREKAELTHLSNVLIFIGLGLMSIFIGIVFINYTNISDTLGISLIFGGIILPIFLIIYSYRKYLYYAAFGELVEKATECSERLDNIKKFLENNNNINEDENTSPNENDLDT